MIPGQEMIPRDCIANDPRNGNGIFAAKKGNEWIQEFGEGIYFIHFLKITNSQFKSNRFHR